SAIASHPLAPKDFATQIETTASLLFESAKNLSRIAKDKGSEINRDSVGNYVRDTSRAFEELMHRLPLGAAEVSTRIASGEMIKLRLEMTESKLLFDFKGTESSTRVAVTELTTLGSCVWSVLALIDEKIAINTGLLSHFAVIAPSGTMLDQKGMIGTERGINVLVPALCNLIISAFAKLNPALKGAECAGGSARLLVESSDERVYLSAACGSRASSKESGEDACTIWSPSLNESRSNSVISWIMRGINPSSGGAGKQKGGNGELVHFKVLKPARLSWDLSAGSTKINGVSGGKPGDLAKLIIIRAGKTDEETLVKERDGHVEVSIGDEVKLFGAGGGGYGEAPAATE
ncbi:MAG: hydantoinase B/oxoprolinase family protein, partial [Bdellovibrionota bacterium]